MNFNYSLIFLSLLICSCDIEESKLLTFNTSEAIENLNYVDKMREKLLIRNKDSTFKPNTFFYRGNNFLSFRILPGELIELHIDSISNWMNNDNDKAVISHQITDSEKEELIDSLNWLYERGIVGFEYDQLYWCNHTSYLFRNEDYSTAISAGYDNYLVIIDSVQEASSNSCLKRRFNIMESSGNLWVLSSNIKF